MAKIVVVGLGAGDEESLSLGVLRLLKGENPVFLRTRQIPVAGWLSQQGISFATFDDVYESNHDFDTVYDQIAGRLLQAAKKNSTVIYAVPGHPMVAERTVRLLLDQGEGQGVEIDIRGGSVSFLETFFARLQVDPIEGFQLLNGTDFDSGKVNPENHLLIAQVYSRFVASEVKLTLMEIYPDDHPVKIVTACGIDGLEKITEVPLYELDRKELFSDLTSVYLPPLVKEEDLYPRFEYLKAVIRHLRSPEGCPWDRKQTHDSLRPYLLEEAYEFLEAVEEKDSDAMAEELGDVLLQVMLHSQIASEEGTFDIHDVIRHLNAKMIRRHPHVFGNLKAETAEDVKQTWDQLKQKEKKQEESSSLLEGVPKHFPALLKAYELQKKAAKAGFDWNDAEEVLKKVQEELKEMSEAETQEEKEEELGDVLFALVNFARFLKVQPELALHGSCYKFERRFRYIESQVRMSQKSWEDFSLEELDAWWDEAKRLEKGE
jgi:tetrapyrrole methylase family protein / MazG family protein